MSYCCSLFVRGRRIHQPPSVALRFSQTLTLLAVPPSPFSPLLPPAPSLPTNAKCVAHTCGDRGMFTQMYAWRSSFKAVTRISATFIVAAIRAP